MENGTRDFGFGFKAMHPRNFKSTDFSTYIYEIEMKFLTRAPLKISSFDNLTRVFSPIVWIAIYLCLAALTLMMFITHRIYTQVDLQGHGLANSNDVPWTNFVLFAFAKFVEPDPIPWFNRFSTGKMLVLIWSLYTMLIVLFFNSNLRTILIATQYEKPFKTLERIIELDRPTYILKEARHFE